MFLGRADRRRVLPRVLEKFRQADTSPTRSHAGLGLGLAIVRRLVELHDGRVTAASEGEGRGATFTVTLALAAVATTPGTDRASDPEDITLEACASSWSTTMPIPSCSPRSPWSST